MANDDQNLEIRISANADGVSSGMDKAVEKTKSGTKEMEGAFGHLKVSATESMEAIAGAAETLEAALAPIAAAASAIAVGFAFKAAIDGANDYAGEVKKLSGTLGITSKEASDLAVSLKLVNIGADEYAGILMKLDRQLKTNEKGLNEIGVKTREVNGAYLPQQTIMQNALSTMMEYKAGTDRNTVSMELFGRSADEAKKALKLNADVMERGKDLAKELGLELGGEALDSSKEYKMQMAEMGIVVESFEHKLGEALMPALTKISEAFVKLVVAIMPLVQSAFELFGEIVGTVADLFKSFADEISAEVKNLGEKFEETFGVKIPNNLNLVSVIVKSLESVFYSFKAAFMDVVVVVAGGIDLLSASMKLFGKIASDVFTMNWSAISGDWNAGLNNIEKTAESYSQKLIQNALSNNEKLKEIWADKPKPKEDDDVKPKGGDKSYSGKNKNGKDDRLAEWKNELQQMHEESSNYFKSTLKEDEEFWQAKLELVKGKSKEDIALRRQIQSQLYAIHKQQAQEEMATKTEAIDHDLKMEKLRLENTKESLANQVALGKVSKEAEISALVQFENEAFDKEKEALEEKKRLYEDDKKAKLKILDEIEVLTQQHLNNLQKLQDQASQAQAKDIQALFDPLTKAIDGSVTGIVTGTTTINKAMLNLGNSFLGEVVSGISKSLAQKAAEYATDLGWYKVYLDTKKTIFGLSESEEAALQKIADSRKIASTEGVAAAQVVADGEISGSATVAGLAKAAASKLSAAAVIPAETAMASMGAAAAVAPTPIVGPELAIEAAASMDTLGASQIALASASAGYDIPAGVNPLTQLHEQEMVLPAHIAEPLRDSLASGKTGGRSPTINIHATDAESVKNLLLNNRGALTHALRTHARMGGLTR